MAWKQPNFVAQVTFHRHRRTQLNIFGAASDVLDAVAPELLPVDSENGSYPDWSASLGGDTESTELPPDQISVVEWSVIAHAIVAVPDSIDIDQMQAANYDAMYLVQESVRAIHAATGEARPLPRLESASFGTIAALQRVSGTKVSTVWHAGIVFPNETLLRTFQELDDAALEQLVDAEAAEGTADPMLRVLDIRRESRVALDAGDTRAAVIMAALSCEMLITVLVSSLLWEEDCWPQEAAPMIEASRELRSRLVSIAGARLRGSWTDSHNQALSDWNRLVQKNRNRIVHAGDAPTVELADDAYQAMLDFESMILDRVANPVARKRYPLTALFLAKHAGLERRDAWTRSMRETAAAAEKDRLLAVFTRWLDATTYLRMSPELRDTPSQGIVKFAMTRDRNSYWVEHDEEVDLARMVKAIGDVDVFERYAWTRRDDPADPRYTASFDPSPRVKPSGPGFRPTHSCRASRSCATRAYGSNPGVCRCLLW